MLGYIIVAGIALFAGATPTYLYQKALQSKLTKSYRNEIDLVKAEWFKGGWDASTKRNERETNYANIMKDQNQK